MSYKHVNYLILDTFYSRVSGISPKAWRSRFIREEYAEPRNNPRVIEFRMSNGTDSISFLSGVTTTVHVSTYLREFRSYRRRRSSSIPAIAYQLT